MTHDNGKTTLDMKRLEEFPALYEATLKEFEPRFLQLVMAHLGWLTSQPDCIALSASGRHDKQTITARPRTAPS
ncbi:hypothetical protein [Herbaspirillum sp. B65]|uniref:hypothetical protein n=1 Tax=Herbaspirillum sp. B65 TaxID=137708 RepID=UPI000347096D